MSVILINPNSTVAMTQAMLQVARAAAPDLAIEGWTSHEGPPAIQGAEDGLAAAAPLMQLVHRAASHGADGIIIGCFDDTALQPAAAAVPCPVIGIGQACYMQAAMRNWRFSVVTTLPVSIPVLQANIEAMGLAAYLGRVRASDVPVLALEDNPRDAQRMIVTEAERAAQEDGVDALVLGCAGMVHVTRAVRDAVGLPVLDPIVVAATAMRWIISSSGENGIEAKTGE